MDEFRRYRGTLPSRVRLRGSVQFRTAAGLAPVESTCVGPFRGPDSPVKNEAFRRATILSKGSPPVRCFAPVDDDDRPPQLTDMKGMI